MDDYNNGITGPGHCSEAAAEEPDFQKNPTGDNSDTDQQEMAAVMPKAYSLAQNYPNPFNPTTTFSFDLPENSVVKLSVYSMNGKQIAVVVKGLLGAGRHTFNWDAPSTMVSGVYFCRLHAVLFRKPEKCYS